jgi:formylglycine-generating enzyme required for sulfatase activity
LVPGGTFNRSNDAANPATVSDFVLDTFEVTVGRFRGFIDSGRGTKANPPAAGAGAHPLIAGTGWDSAWNESLVADPAAMKALLQPLALHTWSDTGLNDALPMNYVTWLEAFAFCIWDGGRLPTEAEWNFAAAGGAEQRTYPWGDAAPDATRASFGCMSSQCSAASLVPAGSKPAGAGRWGHLEMSGNVMEWCFDTRPTMLYKNPCVDCAETTPHPYRAQRGGEYYIAAAGITTAYRSHNTTTERKPTFGFRCARATPR